jgi:hypothetical protein
MTNSSENTDIVDLADKKNYRDNIEFSASEMISTFDTLTRNYLIMIEEHYIKHAPEFGNYMLEKGLNMVCSVFELTLLYTNNLLVTCNAVQRSILLFCEFVSQINHDKYNYLRLSIRDAVLFVYKKTIYRLDNSQACLLTSTEQGIQRHKLLDKHHALISNFVKQAIRQSSCQDSNQTAFSISELNKKLQRLDKKLITISFQTADDEILCLVCHSTLDVLNVITSVNKEGNSSSVTYEAVLKLLSFVKSSLAKRQDTRTSIQKIQARIHDADIVNLIETSRIDCAIKQLIKS